jgi:hypothetical protein
MSAKKYWFRPKRFWGWFAAYYPASAEGWVLTLAAIFILVKIFLAVDEKSHSGSDTLIAFAPWFILIGLVLDIIMRKTGEYPAWWKKWKKK